MGLKLITYVCVSEDFYSFLVDDMQKAKRTATAALVFNIIGVIGGIAIIIVVLHSCIQGQCN